MDRRLGAVIAAFAVAVLGLARPVAADPAFVEVNPAYRSDDQCMGAKGGTDADRRETPDDRNPEYSWSSGIYLAVTFARRDGDLNPIGPTIVCGVAQPKQAGELAVQFIVWKYSTASLGNGEWNACVVKSGWVYNATPGVSDLGIYVRGGEPGTPPKKMGPCGNGWYTVQSWHKMILNGAWVPAAKACGVEAQPRGNPPSCAKSYLSPPHWFPERLCNLWCTTPPQTK